MSRDGGKLHVKATKHPRRIRADRVHANQIIEWCDKRCKVRRVINPAPPRSHRRHRGSNGRLGVILSVMPQGPWEKPVDLHYWADEDVTLLGWSFGADEGWS